jgi:hypothetical protein
VDDVCVCTQALVVGGIKRQPDGKIDYTDDFFGKKAFMTVSGQLQVQTYSNAYPHCNPQLSFI